jgi:hypothetical protein
VIVSNRHCGLGSRLARLEPLNQLADRFLEVGQLVDLLLHLPEQGEDLLPTRHPFGSCHWPGQSVSETGMLGAIRSQV